MLAKQHQALLETRLQAGTLDELTADLLKLGVDVPGALVIRSSVKTATKSQNEALSQGYSLVTVMQRRGATAEVRAAYGVGAKTSAKVVKQVVAAITLILERAAEAEGLGILQKDLVALGEDRAAISSADGVQEEKRARAPGATKERNRTANRILGRWMKLWRRGWWSLRRMSE